MGRTARRRHLDEARALALLVRALEEAARTKTLRPLLRGLFTASQRAELAQRLRIAFFSRAGTTATKDPFRNRISRSVRSGSSGS